MVVLGGQTLRLATRDYTRFARSQMTIRCMRTSLREPQYKKEPLRNTFRKGLEDGAKDGARSRDNQIHNLGLYQLSYFRQSVLKMISELGADAK